MSVNLNEYEIRNGELIICTAGDIVKVSRPDASDAGSWHFVMLAMSHRFASDLRGDFKRILKFRVISKHLNPLSKSSPNVAPFLKLMKKGICH